MGRSINSGLSLGAYGQATLENYELISILIEQKKENKNKEPDFYVGTNGKILSAQYKNWIGKSKRDSLIAKIQNLMLKNAVSQLYRRGAFIGDGGTASVVLFERRTGLGLGKNGGTHEKKARELIVHIKTKILTQNLSASDRKIANKLIKQLKRSLVR